MQKKTQRIWAVAAAAFALTATAHADFPPPPLCPVAPPPLGAPVATLVVDVQANSCWTPCPGPWVCCDNAASIDLPPGQYVVTMSGKECMGPGNFCDPEITGTPGALPVSFSGVCAGEAGVCRIVAEGAVGFPIAGSPVLINHLGGAFRVWRNDCWSGDNHGRYTLSFFPASPRNVPDGAQAGMTTTGALYQLVPALAPGQVCTARLWVGKRSDGGGAWGSWYLQLTSGPWVNTLLSGLLSSQTVEWQQYQKSFRVPAYFTAGTISIQLTGYAGFECYDLVELDCGGGNLVTNGSFEIPEIPDGQSSPAFFNPPPASWKLIPGAGHFNPNEKQLNDIFP